MSTDVDGAQPSTRPGSEPAGATAGPATAPDGPPRDVPVPTAHAPSHPTTVVEAAQSDVEPDTDAVDLHRELARRAAAGGGQPSGRHARQDGNDRPPPRDYVPRHAMSTPGPSTLPPIAAVSAAPAPAAEGLELVPAGEGLELAPAGETVAAEPAGPPPKRVRVVLAERRRPIRPVGTVVHVHDLDDVGEVLAASLIKSQLGLAVRFGAVAAIVLGLLPVAFAAFPAFGRAELLGIRLPWLALGILAYPLLVALGWLYTRATERLEQSFTEHLRD